MDRKAGNSSHERLWLELEGCLLSRRWDAIRTSWVRFIPLMEPVGLRPRKTVSSFLEEGSIYSEALAKGQLGTTRIARGELPEMTFREAVFWLHKAIHVLGATEHHVDGGLPTWALSGAYQSAFFACRSIAAFLGVTFSEFNRASVVVDLCRDIRGLRQRAVEELGAFEEEVPLRSLGVLFDHRQIWVLFQRILKVATRLPWPEGWMLYFAQVPIADITKQRHGLHYQLDYWVMDDMHHSVHSRPFEDVESSGTGRELFDRGRENFTLVAAFALNQMALLLFQNLSELTNRLAPERELFRTTLNPERHPLFADRLRNAT